MLNSINPFTNELIFQHPIDSDEMINHKINMIESNYSLWKSSNLEQRQMVLEKIGEQLIVQKEIFAKLITDEMGKPLVEARLEIEKCAWVCKYYAKNQALFLKKKFLKPRS